MSSRHIFINTLKNSVSPAVWACLTQVSWHTNRHLRWRPRGNALKSWCSLPSVYTVVAFLEISVSIKTCCFVPKPCLTLCSSMGRSPPSFSVHEIFQARILEWVFIFDSNCVHIFPFLNTLFLYVFSIYVYTHTHTHTHIWFVAKWHWGAVEERLVWCWDN